MSLANIDIKNITTEQQAQIKSELDKKVAKHRKQSKKDIAITIGSLLI